MLKNIKMSSTTFTNIPVFIFDKKNYKKHNIFDILLKNSKSFEEIKKILIILNECRNIFKKNENLRNTLLDFYTRIGFKMFNYIFVKDWENFDTILGDDIDIVLEFNNEDYTFQTDQEILSDLEFGLKLGMLFSSF